MEWIYNPEETWFTADPHFWHQNVIKYCKRPFKNQKHMNAEIIKNYQQVGESHTLIILGDLTMVNDSNRIEHLIRQIPGNKILVVGNHDRLKPKAYVNIGFESVHSSLIMYNRKNPDKDILCVHDPALAVVWPRDKYVFHGHVHELWKIQRNLINVAVDVWDFKPVLFSTLLQLIGEEDAK